MNKKWLIVPLASVALLGACVPTLPVEPEPVAVQVAEKQVVEVPVEEPPITETYLDTILHGYAHIAFEGELEGQKVEIWEGYRGEQFLLVGGDVLYTSFDSPYEELDCVDILTGDHVLRFCDAGLNLNVPATVIWDDGSASYHHGNAGEALDDLVLPVMESAQKRYTAYLEDIDNYEELQKKLYRESLLPYLKEALNALE